MAYKISDDCISCGACAAECPVEAISEGDTKYVIDEDTCIGIFEPADENRTVDSYLEKVKIVMRDAEEDNAHICIISGSLEENFDLFGAEAY